MADDIERLHVRDCGLPRKPDARTCQAPVRNLVAEGGRVVATQHAYDRMEERDLNMSQVLSVLKRGEIVEGPKWSARHENWSFSLRADTAGQIVTVNAAIDTDPLFGKDRLVVVVVTAYCG